MKSETLKKANELAKEIKDTKNYLEEMNRRINYHKAAEESGNLNKNELKYYDGKHSGIEVNFISPIDTLELSALKAEKRLIAAEKEFDKLTD